MPLAVWAARPELLAQICVNARLGGAPSHPANPNGQTNGQGGWDIGLNFASLNDLATQLEQLVRVNLPPHMCVQPPVGWMSWLSCQGQAQLCPTVGQLTQLAINAHGLPGRVYLGGKPAEDQVVDPKAEGQALSVQNLNSMAADLIRIYNATAPNSTIFLMSCLAGRGPEGTELLKALSQLYWPDRRIVAFTTVGYQARSRMWRDNEDCPEPGMRDTKDIYQSAPGSQAELDRINDWNNLNDVAFEPGMPWASDTSPGAKIAQNGQIIRQSPYDAPEPASQPSRLPRQKGRTQHVAP
jgi:hypothetical protein